MRKKQEILRLKAAGLSNRQIAKSINVSPSTVSLLLSQAEKVGLSWPLPEGMDEAALNAVLYPVVEKSDKKPLPDMANIHKEMMKKSVTMQLLWEEYNDQNPSGYRYSYFCDLYYSWRKKLDPPLRQVHKAGEKMFIDFAGDTVPIQDPKTGEIYPAYIFIAVLGASNYSFVRAVLAQDLENWMRLHCMAFEFFDGVTEVLVPDNPRVAVTSPCRYEPDLNPTYQELAEHFGCVVIPGRPYRPRDKAKAESGVLHIERQILARFRNRTFFSIDELNIAIEKESTIINEKPFQKLEGSRKSWYEAIDKPALKPLPQERYEMARWKTLQVNIDYHVQLELNFYSAPYQLIREKVDVRFTSSTVEILHKGKRITSHVRLYGKGKHSTNKEHMPPSHQAHLEWTPSRIIMWAEKTGPAAAELAQELLKRRAHPEQAYRSCLGILRLGDKYGADRLEAACKRAITCGAFSYKSVRSILETGLDRLLPEEKTSLVIPIHENIRGASYYKIKEVPHANPADCTKA